MISYILNGENETEVFDSSSNGPVTAEAFSITSLSDTLDPYAYVVVKHNQSEDMFTAKDKLDTVWTEPGEYSILCVNRLGYGYTIHVTVTSSDGSAIASLSTTEITAQPTSKPELQTIETETVEEPASEETSRGLLSSEWAEETNTAEELKEQETETKGQDAGSDKNQTIIIIIIAGLALIAGLIVFIYRRGKLYTRMTDAMKSEEEARHE